MPVCGAGRCWAEVAGGVSRETGGKKLCVTVISCKVLYSVGIKSLEVEELNYI